MNFHRQAAGIVSWAERLNLPHERYEIIVGAGGLRGSGGYYPKKITSTWPFSGRIAAAHSRSCDQQMPTNWSKPGETRAVLSVDIGSDQATVQSGPISVNRDTQWRYDDSTRCSMQNNQYLTNLHPEA
jgi:hypothetical protein